MMTKRAALALLLSTLTSPLTAAPPILSCEEGRAVFDDDARALQRLEPEEESDFSSCKPWPADPTRTLHALASLEPGSGFTEDLGSDEYDLDVLVTDSASGRLLARHRQRKALLSDAMRLKGITLDTARARWSCRRPAAGGWPTWLSSPGQRDLRGDPVSHHASRHPALRRQRLLLAESAARIRVSAPPQSSST